MIGMPQEVHIDAYKFDNHLRRLFGEGQYEVEVNSINEIWVTKAPRALIRVRTHDAKIAKEDCMAETHISEK